MKYYVYKAMGINGEVLYVGNGSGDRYKHCNSGISHCYGLNEYHFKYGKDSIGVNILSYFYTECEALKYEESCIKNLKPLFNTNLVDKVVKTPIEKLESGDFLNFTEWSKLYYEANLKKDVEIATKLHTCNKEFSEILNTIGIDEIKRTGFHKTKSKVKYKKVLGLNQVTSSKTKAYKNLRVKEGGFYTYSELREKLQACFDKFNIKAKAKATDIKMVYNVKRTTRNGVEGYLIGDKI